MTILGKRKRGDDWTFRGIFVGDSLGAAIPDLADSDVYTIRCVLKKGSATVTPTWDTAALADSRVVLSVARAVSGTMSLGKWKGDLEVTGPQGRQSSTTFYVEVVEDVT